MEPPPLSRIAGAQCFIPSIGPVRLTAIVRFRASTVVSTIPWRAIVPALLTRMWRLPKRANAAATTSCHDASSAASWRRNSTLPPLGSQPSRQPLACGNIDVGHDDRSLFAHEESRVRGPLQARGAGDQRHFACKPRHFLAFRFRFLTAGTARVDHRSQQI